MKLTETTVILSRAFASISPWCRRRLQLVVWLSLLSAGACSFGGSDAQCTEQNASQVCKVTEVCHRGFCVDSSTAPTTPSGGTGVAGPKGGNGGSNSSQGGSVGTSPNTMGGTGSSNTGGNMSMMPECTNPVPETCNNKDDDCDGAKDENIVERCFPPGAKGCLATDMNKCTGSCSYGLQTCRDGVISGCTGPVVAQAEACTTGTSAPAADEDCDGKIDEECTCKDGESLDCYDGPAGTLGKGTCKAGKQTCVGSAYGACTASVKPAAETCANEGADNDCNGTADDIEFREDPCTVAGNMGACSVGRLRCMGGSDLTCVATTTPKQETCNNADDDCNGMIDDNIDLKSDAKNCGACGKVCGAGEQCCNSTCVNTNTDKNNCGGCGGTHVCGAQQLCCSGACERGSSCDAPAPGGQGGSTPPAGGSTSTPPTGGSTEPVAGTTSTPPTGGTTSTPPAGGTSAPVAGTISTPPDAGTSDPCGGACATGQTCCGGQCVDTRSDINHCGTCTNVCSGAALNGCCEGSCKDLTQDTTCGACSGPDANCTSLGLVGGTCTCQPMDGVYKCAGLDVGNVLQVCLKL